MSMDYEVMYDLNPNPYAFFSTAAGPDISDLVGQPGSVLDVYPDGSPMASEQSGIANAVGGGVDGLPPFFKRRDVKALIMLGVGLWMLHQHMRS